jgi:predicted secreted protein
MQVGGIEEEVMNRSKRVVAVMHCILNQNARDHGAAVYAGANTDLLPLLTRHEVGILQLPCPEMAFMGLDRARGEDQTIRDVIDTPEGHAFCRELSRHVVDAIEDYLANDYSVEAVLGGDVGSPGCAVHHVESAEGRQALAAKSGVFMFELIAELHARGIDVPFKGIRDSSPKTLKEDLAWVEERLANS